MRKCNKCNMIKELEEFASYIHKHTGNLYTRHICKVCFRAGNIAYKKSIRPRQCIQCGEKKLAKDFYIYKSLGPNDKRHNICKICTCGLEKRRKNYKYNKREDNGEPVHWRPNTYNSKEQKELAFELMTSLGFTFSPETGRWSKEGFKNPDGTFVRIEERKRLKFEKKQKETEHLNIWQRITYLREEGNSINEISRITGVNYTAVHKFIRYGSKTKQAN